MSRRLHAFTLVELLLVVAIIAMLTGLLIVSLHGLRDASNRTETLSAIRGMCLAYNEYSTDNRDRLLPGYLDEVTLNAFEAPPIASPIKTLLETREELSYLDAGSYVWRLAPYMDHIWQPFMTDYRSKELISKLDPVISAGEYGFGSCSWDPGDPTLCASAIPSIGLNSIFVGGDGYHGGTAITNRNPWFPTNADAVLAATRYSEVKNPAKLILFGTTQFYNQTVFGSMPVLELTYGYCELRPPYIPDDNGNWDPDLQQWGVTGRDHIDITTNADFTAGGGIPVGRWGSDRIPVGHLDGSTAVMDLNEIAPPHPDVKVWSTEAIQSLMIHWSPYAVGVFD